MQWILFLCSIEKEIRVEIIKKWKLLSAYAWVKCEREEENDCGGVFLKGGIIGRNATAFEADKRYVRLSLLKREDNFALLESRLQALVS